MQQRPGARHADQQENILRDVRRRAGGPGGVAAAGHVAQLQARHSLRGPRRQAGGGAGRVPGRAAAGRAGQHGGEVHVQARHAAQVSTSRDTLHDKNVMFSCFQSPRGLFLRRPVPVPPLLAQLRGHGIRGGPLLGGRGLRHL